MLSESLKLAILFCLLHFTICQRGFFRDRIVAGPTLLRQSVNDLSYTGTNRNVVLEITNHLDVPLQGGDDYVNWGYRRTASRAIIRPHTREAFLFDAADGTATGTAGLLSYTIADPKENVKFFIVFSVPYNYIHSSNWFGLKIIPSSVKVDHALYKTAYYDKAWKSPTQTARYGYAYQGKHVTISHGDYVITASMTNLGRSVVGVDVYKKGDGENDFVS